MLVVGIGIAAAGWAFLPSDPGLAGLFCLVQRILLTAAGAAFVALGATVGWSRVGTVVDREHGRLILVRRVLLLRREKELPLQAIRRVEVGGGRDLGGCGPGWIEFHLGEGRGRETFGFGQSAAALRRLAAWIRDWSGLPAAVFVGMAPGEPVQVLAPEPFELNGALQRLERSRRVAVERGEGRVVVELLPAGWGGLALLFLLAGLGAAALLAVFWHRAFAGGLSGLPAGGALVLSAVPFALLLSAVHVARSRVRFEVRDGLLTVERRGPFRNRRETVPVAGIADVRVTLVGSKSASWALLVLGQGEVPLHTVAHTPLQRRRGDWEDIAVVLRAALAPTAP